MLQCCTRGRVPGPNEISGFSQLATAGAQTSEAGQIIRRFGRSAQRSGADGTSEGFAPPGDAILFRLASLDYDLAHYNEASDCIQEAIALGAFGEGLPPVTRADRRALGKGWNRRAAAFLLRCG